MAQKKKIKKGSGDGVDLLDKNESKNKSHPPSKYKVIYHNDDYTPMELVTISLIFIYRLTPPTANEIMLKVHQSGKAVVQGGLSKEIAETKVNKTIQFFKENGYPLLATIEKE